MRDSFFFTPPTSTPRSLRYLLALTVAISLLSPLLSYFLSHTFSLPGPNHWLPVSLLSLQERWLWTPLTYLFLQTTDFHFSVGFFTHLFFQLLFVWWIGAEIIRRQGAKKFLALYLGAGICAGLVTTAALFYFPTSTILVGNAPSLNALLIIWAMLYPEVTLAFFFFLRLKGKWLVAAYIGWTLLLPLSQTTPLIALANLIGTGVGFIVGRLFWKYPNPYPLGLSLFPSPSPRSSPSPTRAEIIDICVEQEKDEDFMHRMLDKISANGSDSLTARERARMDKISHTYGKK